MGTRGSQRLGLLVLLVLTSSLPGATFLSDIRQAGKMWFLTMRAF